MPYEDCDESVKDSTFMATVPTIRMQPPPPFQRSNTCRTNLKNASESRHPRPVRQCSVDERYSDSFFRSKPSFESSNNSPKLLQQPSSALITKMRSIKDKVHRHMIQTVQSGDWPPPYVLYSDRYNLKTSLERHVSDSSSMEPLKQRRCLRMHRGYSVDSYSLQNQNNPSIIKSNDSSQTKSSGGIICSQTDMEAIKARYSSDYESRDSGQSSSKRLSQNFPKRHSYPAMLEADDPSSKSNPPVKKTSAYEMQTRICDPKHSTTVTELRVGDFNDLESIGRANLDSITPSTSRDAPKDIEYDEHGQTWEIYGADPDPVLLGQAIQSHLDSIMKQNNIQPPSGDFAQGQHEPEDNVKVKKFWKRWFCLTKFNRSNSRDSSILSPVITKI